MWHTEPSVLKANQGLIKKKRPLGNRTIRKRKEVEGSRNNKKQKQRIEK